MGLVVIGAVLAVYYAGDRAAALWRKKTMNSRRAKADYPITFNDPVDRHIM